MIEKASAGRHLRQRSRREVSDGICFFITTILLRDLQVQLNGFCQTELFSRVAQSVSKSNVGCTPEFLLSTLKIVNEDVTGFGRSTREDEMV